MMAYRIAFTKTESEIIKHRLEIITDIMFDVDTFFSGDTEDPSELPYLPGDIEQVVEILEGQFKRGCLVIGPRCLDDNQKPLALVVLFECLEGSTLIGLAEDEVGASITPQKFSRLVRAFDSAKQTVSKGGGA